MDVVTVPDWDQAVMANSTKVIENIVFIEIRGKKLKWKNNDGLQDADRKPQAVAS